MSKMLLLPLFLLVCLEAMMQPTLVGSFLLLVNDDVTKRWTRKLTKTTTNQPASLLFMTATPPRRPSTASERERREEDKRRQQRAKDVVIGKTSARQGETDFALDIQATEQEFFRQASQVEQQVYRQTELGMYHLKMLQLEEATACFDKVFELRPTAYLWQAGIAKYYQNEWQDAAEIFASAALRFESRFGEPATEERLWRHACELKLSSSLVKQERKRMETRVNHQQQQPEETENDAPFLVAQMPEITQETQDLLDSERRKVLKIARELFDASYAKDRGREILARARLRSVGGAYVVGTEHDNSSNNNNNKNIRTHSDHKMWKLTSWFYLGLYYDALGLLEESKKCMKMALRLCPSVGNALDIVHTLPFLHMARRDWFDDDDDFESNLFKNKEHGNDRNENDQETANRNPSADDPLASSSSSSTPTKQFSPAQKMTTTTTSTTDVAAAVAVVNNHLDPVLVETLKEGVDALIVDELREALHLRGISAVGSKDQLRGKLFDSLLRDVGYGPWTKSF